MADPYYLANIIGESIIGVAAVLANGLVLLLIAKDRRLQTLTNHYVASLATADFLVGFVGIPCVILAIHGHPRDFHGCLMVNSMIVVLTQISIFGMLAIAFERFFAIKSPFKYQSTCTRRLCLATIALSWMAAILVGLTPLFGWNLQPENFKDCTFTEVIDMRYMVYFNFFVCVLVPLVVTLLIYLYIYTVVIRHLKLLNIMPANQNQVSPATPGAPPLPANRLRHLQRDIKAAKWFAVVIFFFCICWLPIHIMNCMTLFHLQTNYPAVIAAILLSHLNSAVNPLFYALGNSKFRQAWRKLIGKPNDEEGRTSASAIGARTSANAINIIS